MDKALAHLMVHGLKVEGGDQLGKTIIFAKNSRHAQFIVERFDANYPHYAGQFARLIDYSVSYAQSLIDDFSQAQKLPHIAVSVDMLDTGINVPEVLNLVFFKPVRSKTKFWQMVGRGTRLCPDLLGPGKDKEHFLVFDFCQNFEFFNADVAATEGLVAAPLRERLFRTWVELLGEIRVAAERGDDHAGLADGLRQRLHEEVAGMNVDNFIVRPKRRHVECFQQRTAWDNLNLGARQELVEHVAGLLSAFRDDALEARQFDLLALTGQLLLLQGDPDFERVRTRIVRVAADLELLGNIPSVAKQMALIQEIQSDGYWQDATPEMVEDVRRRLRDLVQLIGPKKRKVVVTDFTDQIGAGAEVGLHEVASGVDAGRCKMKVRRFIERHADHIAIQKLRRAEQLTPQDLSELERMMREEEAWTSDEAETSPFADGLGAFCAPSLASTARPLRKRSAT